MWGSGDFDFASSNSVGDSGGLLVIWNKDFFKANSIVSHGSFIVMEGVINNIFPCCVVNMYAPNEVRNKRSVWEELLAIKVNSQSPWCVGGDFNEISNTCERVGCVRLDRGMKDFVEFRNNMGLVDLPMSGRKFT